MSNENEHETVRWDGLNSNRMYLGSYANADNVILHSVIIFARNHQDAMNMIEQTQLSASTIKHLIKHNCNNCQCARIEEILPVGGVELELTNQPLVNDDVDLTNNSVH